MLVNPSIIANYPYNAIILHGFGKQMPSDIHLAEATTAATAARPIEHETRHGRDCRSLVCGSSVEAQMNMATRKVLARAHEKQRPRGRIKAVAQVPAQIGMERQGPKTGTTDCKRWTVKSVPPRRLQVSDPKPSHQRTTETSRVTSPDRRPFARRSSRSAWSSQSANRSAAAVRCRAECP